MSERRMSTANKVKLAAALVGLVLIVIIILQNMETARTDILMASIEMPRAVLLIITLLIGFAAGALTTWIYANRRKP